MSECQELKCPQYYNVRVGHWDPPKNYEVYLIFPVRDLVE